MRRSTAIKKFFSTPKGLLIIILAILLALTAPHEGPGLVAPELLSAVIAAGLLDAVILRTKRTAWEFPSGAVLTALIVTMILSAQAPWYVAMVTSVVAVISKYVCRTRLGNVFNPAAVGIVAAFYLFHTGQSWWGAAPEAAVAAQVALVAAGMFITDRVNKTPLVLSFLGAYYLLFTVTAFVSNPAGVSEVFRTPDLQAALYFAFFILTDPPTSPVRYPDQLVCGVIVAAVSFAVFEWIGAAYYLLAGVLVGNVWEAWRRTTFRTRRTQTWTSSNLGKKPLPSA
jgi:Na+-translocating ferredoxin:NAD+ oxidoreductase RnfD subunit